MCFCHWFSRFADVFLTCQVCWECVRWTPCAFVCVLVCWILASDFVVWCGWLIGCPVVACFRFEVFMNGCVLYNRVVLLPRLCHRSQRGHYFVVWLQTSNMFLLCRHWMRAMKACSGAMTVAAAASTAIAQKAWLKSQGVTAGRHTLPGGSCHQGHEELQVQDLGLLEFEAQEEVCHSRSPRSQLFHQWALRVHSQA